MTDRNKISWWKKLLGNAGAAFLFNKKKRHLVRERLRAGVTAIKSSNVDFVISGGSACRSAHFLSLMGLRKFSAPMDWMTGYSLSQWFLPLENLDFFFVNWREEHSEMPKERRVVDTVSGTISLHDFSSEKSVSEQMPEFRTKMARRVEKLKTMLDNASPVGGGIGVAMNWAVPPEELIGFSEKLSSLFPATRFRILNVRHNEDLQTPDSVRWRVLDAGHKCENVFLCEVEFDDRGSSWKGNKKMWPIVLREFFRKNSPIGS